MMARNNGLLVHTTLECGALESNRFDFWNQRNRISLEPKFHQNRRKFGKSAVTPLIWKYRDHSFLWQKLKRRTFQPPPPAYDNHAFRPGQAPGGAGALGGPKQITASSVYQRHNPTGQMGAGGQQGFGGQGQGQFGQVNQAFTNSYSQFQPQFNQNQAIKPNPLRSYR